MCFTRLQVVVVSMCGSGDPSWGYQILTRLRLSGFNSAAQLKTHAALGQTKSSETGAIIRPVAWLLGRTKTRFVLYPQK